MNRVTQSRARSVRGEAVARAELLDIETRGRALVDLTSLVSRVVRESGVEIGTCTVFVRHTSASLVVQENADPSVQRDLERWMARLAPESSSYEHDAEGPDDMPSHLRSAITKTSETLPVLDGELVVGTWQAIYLWEHRSAPHRRRVDVVVTGVGSVHAMHTAQEK